MYDDEPLRSPLSELTISDRARYEWQMWLPGWGDEGQQRLKGATVLVSRVGGVGGNAALHLAAAGVGTIVLAHAGNAKESDLHRQILLTSDAVGQPRLPTFLRRLRELNPAINLRGIAENPSVENAARLIDGVDLVVSAAPLFGERLALNTACVAARKPLVDCALFGWEGHVTTIVPGRTACLACLYPETPPAWKRQFPVVSPVSGVIGSLAAAEAVKWLTGLGDCAVGRLLLCDVATGDFRTLPTTRLPDCAACGGM
jgi:molybdopterin/thiamine biosynthesis adenylyltransferase